MQTRINLVLGFGLLLIGLILILSSTFVITGFSVVKNIPETKSNVFSILSMAGGAFFLFLEKRNKAVFFSLDAIIAITIILVVILLSVPFSKLTRNQSDLPRDIISTLSSLKISDINSEYVHTLITNGDVTDPNKTVLEQIGEFYVTNITKAKGLGSDVIKDIETKENIGLWYGSTLIASKGLTPYGSAQDVEVARQIISGIQEGGNLTGFSARAFLSGNLQNEYSYFGGYVGDGDVSTRIEYNGTIISAELEAVVRSDSNNFNIIVNGDQVGFGSYYQSSDEYTPVKYTLLASAFQSGINTIELRGENLHVAGGFIKVTYDSTINYKKPLRYYFPGIKGLVNLFDGFYIPGELNKMTIFLHANSTETPLFINIGDTTVFNNTIDESNIIEISNSELDALINYRNLVNETIPLRLGLENVSFVTNQTFSSDVISVTDLSGSMIIDGGCTGGWGTAICCAINFPQCLSTQNVCENTCGGTYFPNRFDLAIQANHDFVDAVLSVSGNRVGLIGYGTTTSESQSLTNISSDLHEELDRWEIGEQTCICCGINSAKTEIILNGSPNSFKSMIVMSDGDANVKCPEQNTGNAKQDAIQAACEAYQDENISVHAVAFGSDADQTTLAAIAACGNGLFYESTNISQITEIYQEVAQVIYEAAYVEQTIIVSGDLYTELYPDSYIEFNYTEPEIPFGLIATLEKKFDNATRGTFSLPNDAEIIETIVSSYSGPRWTDTVLSNGVTAFSLSDYGSNYISLGDPYFINIPNSLIGEGVGISGSGNTIIDIQTGLSPTETYQGSSENKMIYTIVKNASLFSPVQSLANGCIWNIQFEDDSEIEVKVPNGYPETDECYYTINKPFGQTDPGGEITNENDAYQVSTQKLLLSLDLDGNNKVDIQFLEQDLEIDLSEVQGIPFTWSTEVQVRSWT
jgi:hypothetical protein